MLDVIVAGAGPAGSMAALVLARAGARVLIVDRESFPRDKLCGDTVNPGAIEFLHAMGLVGGPLDEGQPLRGMILSGTRAVVSATYGGTHVGRSVRRYDFDMWMLERAIEAGARFESALVARQPLFQHAAVRGLVLSPRGKPDRTNRVPASTVIAADGSRSALARSLGLLAVPQRPRRWAFGAYATGISGVTDLGEMHVRRTLYVGIAPMGGGVANVCVVTGARPEGRGPREVMARAIDADPALAARFANAMFLGPPRVLGPLASEASSVGVEGLLLAGDAAGFIDPMTGDGLHLAIRGGVLAAQETLRALETSDFVAAPLRLAEARRAALGSKLRFNRVIRAVTGSPATIDLLSVGAAIIPGIMRPVIRYAGDVSNGGPS